MKNTYSSMLKAGVAPMVLGMALFSGQAYAQDNPNANSPDCKANPDSPACQSTPAAASDNAIVVTGSITRNPSAATASPVVSVTAQDLQQRGVSTVADALQTLTANNAGTAAPSWSSFGFATGASAVSLRGLNDAYTLTLFNGLRSAYYPLGDDGSRNFVDANAMPESITDHIDVLLDGASATYGADAVAGVVDIIPKREIQGFHANASFGESVKYGDAREYRVDGTYGYGDLDSQGFNIYVNGEYQKNTEVDLNDRPYGVDLIYGDASRYCGTAAQGCLNNAIRNGIQYDGSYNGLQSTAIPFVRPYTFDPATGAVTGAAGPYQMLNPAAGCGPYTAHTLTPAEIASSGQGAILPTNHIVCQQDISNFLQYNSPTTRWGANLKATIKVGDNAEAYAMVNWYDVKENTQVWPYGFAGVSSQPNEVDVLSIMLPAYVCPQGHGELIGTTLVATGCTDAAGAPIPGATLNTRNNPFAASGEYARLLQFNPIPQITDTDASTLRFSAGLDGSYKGWNYSVAGTTSEVRLFREFKGYPYIPGMMAAIAQGTFDFSNVLGNSPAALEQIMPTVKNESYSILSQGIVSVNRDLFNLPGGALNVAVSGQYRYEAVHAPTPALQNPYDLTQQYLGLNTSTYVDGTRHVWSAAYEISAPILDILHVKADGSYDSYSTGQSHFSPKFEAIFQPVQQIKLRGTFSKGFRIPSFAQSFALYPVTGFTNSQINCATYAAFCAAHATDTSYYSGTYQVGLTSDPSPTLAPEKSTGWTLGAVLQPIHNFTFTADFYQTKIKGVIVPVSLTQQILNQYYNNNGVVTIPGIKVTPSQADPQNPNALPLLGFVEAPYQNAAQLLVRGIDFTATARFHITDSITWTSDANASLLLKLQQTNADGTVWRYDGSLGACNITACSGAPRWRAVWTNTLNFADRAKISLTAYYTSSYSEVAADSGGTYGDCAASAAAGQVYTWPNGDPVRCRSQATFDLDGHAEYKFMDGRFTIYGDMLNILGTKPQFDPNAAYGLYGFQPAWQDKLFIGRWFRIGAKVDWGGEHKAPPPPAPLPVAAPAPVAAPPPPPPAPAPEVPPPPPPPAPTGERG